jgi:F-type H+-transporting ATPase subunit alpha
MKQVSGTIKLDLAQFREMEAFSQFASDLDQSTRKLLDRGRRLTEILKQPQYQPLTVEEQVVVIYAGVNGFLDSIDIKEVTNFEKDLLKSLNSNGKNILEIIQKDQSISKETEEKLNVFIAEISEKYKKD